MQKTKGLPIKAIQIPTSDATQTEKTTPEVKTFQDLARVLKDDMVFIKNMRLLQDQRLHTCSEYTISGIRQSALKRLLNICHADQNFTASNTPFENKEFNLTDRNPFIKIHHIEKAARKTLLGHIELKNADVFSRMGVAHEDRYDVRIEINQQALQKANIDIGFVYENMIKYINDTNLAPKELRQKSLIKRIFENVGFNVNFNASINHNQIVNQFNQTGLVAIEELNKISEHHITNEEMESFEYLKTFMEKCNDKTLQYHLKNTLDYIQKTQGLVKNAEESVVRLGSNIEQSQEMSMNINNIPDTNDETKTRSHIIPFRNKKLYRSGTDMSLNNDRQSRPGSSTSVSRGAMLKKQIQQQKQETNDTQQSTTFQRPQSTKFQRPQSAKKVDNESLPNIHKTQEKRFILPRPPSSSSVSSVPYNFGNLGRKPSFNPRIEEYPSDFESDSLGTPSSRGSGSGKNFEKN